MLYKTSVLCSRRNCKALHFKLIAIYVKILQTIYCNNAIKKSHKLLKSRAVHFTFYILSQIILQKVEYITNCKLFQF